MYLPQKFTALLLTLAMALSLAGCGGASSTKKDTVAVQSVSMLMGLDLSGLNRYSGVAEAKSSQKIQKDSDKTVSECLVTVGQEVKAGDVLFRYDVEAMKLTVESSKLELEQLQNQIKSYESQISQLEKDKKKASKSEQLSYTLQIQEAKLDLSEAQYNLKQKQMDLEKLEKGTENSEVCAEADGVVQSIQDDTSGGDYYGGDSGNAYITIMETGTYRIKGTVSEANVSALYEGMEVTVQSRTDSTAMWRGTVSEIDTGSTQADSQNNGYVDESSGESASKYTFYVELTDSEGMMMGQHLYIMPYVVDQSQGSGVVLPESFITDPNGDAYVWAASSGDTLEKRPVTLGEHDETMLTYAIESGLSLNDYVADPSAVQNEGQAVVKYDADSYSFSGGDNAEGEYTEGDFAEGSMGEDYTYTEGEGEQEAAFNGEAENYTEGNEDGELAVLPAEG